MAYRFYVTVQGAKQGKFKGEPEQKGFGAGKIGGVKYLASSQAPRDIATGQASGKRQWQPIRFTKRWDAATPQFIQALVTNEVLTSVVFEFTQTDPAGKEAVHFTVKLTNATISSVNSYLDLTAKSGAPFDAAELEDVELTFQKIEFDDHLAKTTVADDWHAVLEPMPVNPAPTPSPIPTPITPHPVPVTPIVTG